MTTIMGRIIPVTGVSLNTVNLSLLTGATSQLTVRFAPADVINRVVSWMSSNTAVAMVSDAGLVTVRTAGTTTITVTTADGVRTATCTITVMVPVYAYSVNGNGGTVSGGT
jgi:uncharacterized protein YjdB